MQIRVWHQWSTRADLQSCQYRTLFRLKFVLFWKAGADGRTDDMCKNNDHNRPWLWLGLVDQLYLRFIIVNWAGTLSWQSQKSCLISTLHVCREILRSEQGWLINDPCYSFLRNSLPEDFCLIALLALRFNDQRLIFLHVYKRHPFH